MPRVAVGAQRLLQVADAHVVADDRQVVAAERSSGRARGSARSPPAPWPGRSARRRAGAARSARRRPRCAARAIPRVSRALAREVDVHAEQVGAGLGEDLGEARRAPSRSPDAVARRAPGALEQDDRLQHVRVERRPRRAAASTSGRQRAVRARAGHGAARATWRRARGPARPPRAPRTSRPPGPVVAQRVGACPAPGSGCSRRAAAASRRRGRAQDAHDHGERGQRPSAAGAAQADERAAPAARPAVRRR